MKKYDCSCQVIMAAIIQVHSSVVALSSKGISNICLRMGKEM